MKRIPALVKYISCIEQSILSYQNEKSTTSELVGAITATLYIALSDNNISKRDYRQLQRIAEFCCKNKLTPSQLAEDIKEGKHLKQQQGVSRETPTHKQAKEKENKNMVENKKVLMHLTEEEFDKAKENCINTLRESIGEDSGLSGLMMETTVMVFAADLKQQLFYAEQTPVN